MASASPPPSTLGKHPRDEDAIDNTEDIVDKRQRADDISYEPEDTLFVPEDDLDGGGHGLNDGTDDRHVEDDGSEESEDDDDDDEDEPLIPYDSALEQLPSLPCYDKDFAQVIRDLEGIGKKAIDIIDEHSCKSRRAAGCRSNAEAVANAPEARVLEIGLFGDTGAGMYWLAELS